MPQCLLECHEMAIIMQQLRRELKSANVPKFILAIRVKIQLMASSDGETQQQLRIYWRIWLVKLFHANVMVEAIIAIRKLANVW